MNITTNARLACFFFRLYFKFFGIEIRSWGNEKIQPGTAGKVFLVDFISPLDPAVVSVVLPNPLCFLIPEHYAQIPIVRWVSSRMGNVYFQKGIRIITTIKNIKQRLKEGINIALFLSQLPSSDGYPNPTPEWLITVLKRLNVSFLPVAIVGSREVLRPGEWIPKVHEIRVLIGKEMHLSSVQPSHDVCSIPSRKYLAKQLQKTMFSIFFNLLYNPQYYVDVNNCSQFSPSEYKDSDQKELNNKIGE